jgi:hypothetical protein
MVRGLSRIVLALGAASIVAGCSLLYGFGAQPDFSMPTPTAIYREGRATVKIGTGPAMELTAAAEAGTFDPTFGAGATFSNAEGWYVRISGASKTGGLLGSSAFLQLDRIVGNQHWTTWDPTRCIVTIDTADEKSLAGTATCKGLRWADAIGFGMTGDLDPPYVKGEPAFDADITFEAKPSSTRTS